MATSTAVSATSVTAAGTTTPPCHHTRLYVQQGKCCNVAIRDYTESNMGKKDTHLCRQACTDAPTCTAYEIEKHIWFRNGEKKVLDLTCRLHRTPILAGNRVSVPHSCKNRECFVPSSETTCAIKPPASVAGGGSSIAATVGSSSVESSVVLRSDGSVLELPPNSCIYEERYTLAGKCCKTPVRNYTRVAMDDISSEARCSKECAAMCTGQSCVAYELDKTMWKGTLVQLDCMLHYGRLSGTNDKVNCKNNLCYKADFVSGPCTSSTTTLTSTTATTTTTTTTTATTTTWVFVCCCYPLLAFGVVMFAIQLLG